VFGRRVGEMTLLAVLPRSIMSDPIRAARSCGACTLCCKLMKIIALDKPHGAWCAHCKQGSGCTIYERRPDECRSFMCGFLQLPELDEAWRPSNSKIILVSELDGKRISAYVDPQRPDAWRKEPYYSQLKRWAILKAPEGVHVAVAVGRRIIMVFPDRDVDLGVAADDEILVTSEKMTPDGPRLEAFKVHKDDPRLQALAEPPRLS
jgi:hypothetical protein